MVQIAEYGLAWFLLAFSTCAFGLQVSDSKLQRFKIPVFILAVAMNIYFAVVVYSIKGVSPVSNVFKKPTASAAAPVVRSLPTAAPTLPGGPPPMSSGPVSFSADLSEECFTYNPSELYIVGNSFTGYITDGRDRKIYGRPANMRFPYSTVVTPFALGALLGDLRQHDGMCWPFGYDELPQFFGDLLIRWDDSKHKGTIYSGNCQDAARYVMTTEKDTEKGPIFILLSGVRSLMFLPDSAQTFMERSRHSHSLCVVGNLPFKYLASRFLDPRNSPTQGVIVYWK